MPACALTEFADCSLDGFNVAGAVERRGVQVSLKRRFAVRGEVDEPACFVDGFDGALAGIARDHPLARCQWSQQRAVLCMQVKMPKAAAHRRPDETASLTQEGEFIVQIDPGVAALLE